MKPGLSSSPLKNHEEHINKFYIYSKTLRCFYPSENACLRYYGNNVSKWLQGKVIEKTSKYSCTLAQLCYMSNKDDVYLKSCLNNQDLPEEFVANALNHLFLKTQKKPKTITKPNPSELETNLSLIASINFRAIKHQTETYTPITFVPKELSNLKNETLYSIAVW